MTKQTKTQAIKELHEIQELVKRVELIFAGRDDAIICATLGHLLATLLVRHHPDAREEMLTLHGTFVKDLVPINEEIMGSQWR